MGRLIDANALKEYFFRPYSNEESYSNIEIAKVIDEQPTIKRRRKAMWVRLEGDSRFMCSVCKWKENVPTIMGEPDIWCYCPSCGSVIRGERGMR